MKRKNNLSEFLKLFLFILTCTFLSFGGGNAVMPTVRKYAVEKKSWMTNSEFDEAVIVTNLLPGPSVIEILSIISIKRLGKMFGSICVIIGVIPHLALFFVVYFLLNKYLDQKYLIVVNLGAIPLVIASLLRFSYNYIKTSKKEVKLIIFTIIAFSTFCFCFFVPSPYNIAAIPMVALIIVILTIDYIKRSKGRKC